MLIQLGPGVEISKADDIIIDAVATAYASMLHSGKERWILFACLLLAAFPGTVAGLRSMWSTVRMLVAIEDQVPSFSLNLLSAQASLNPQDLATQISRTRRESIQRRLAEPRTSDSSSFAIQRPCDSTAVEEELVKPPRATGLVPYGDEIGSYDVETSDTCASQEGLSGGSVA